MAELTESEKRMLYEAFKSGYGCALKKFMKTEIDVNFAFFVTDVEEEMDRIEEERLARIADEEDDEE